MRLSQAVEGLSCDININSSSSSSSSSSSEDDGFPMDDAFPMEDDSDEEDTLDTEDLAIFLSCIGKQRIPKWQLDRLNWNNHVSHQMHTDEFTQKYRMTLETFNKLCEILRPDITVDPIKSQNSTPRSLPIYPELVMAIGIRWLAGGSYHDIKDFCGVSKSSFYRVRNLFLDACLAADEIKIQFPSTTAQLNETASGFASRSTHLVFLKCVGALDGLLVKIVEPSNVTNQRDYFSGHYQHMGINIQAMCDSKCRFIYVAVGGPGNFINVFSPRFLQASG
jgi:hypothetical protein